MANPVRGILKYGFMLRTTILVGSVLSAERKVSSLIGKEHHGTKETIRVISANIANKSMQWTAKHVTDASVRTQLTHGNWHGLRSQAGDSRSFFISPLEMILSEPMDRNSNASLMEIATFSSNKLNMKKEIWAETGESDTFPTIRLLK